ncbi:endoplasmic reticulum aminopeptidase 2, partial [Cricetulus griseus]
FKTIEFEGGLVEDYFEATMRISTYLIAYIVFDFELHNLIRVKILFECDLYLVAGPPIYEAKG